MNLGLAVAGLMLVGTASGNALLPHHLDYLVWIDLSIEEGEVLLSLQGRPDPLGRNLGLSSSLDESLELGDLARISAEISNYFRDHNPLSIDGERVQPVLRQVDIPVDSEDEDGWMVVVVDLAYACDGMPRKVSLVWESFEGADYQGEQFIPVLVKHGRFPDLGALYPEEPEFTWHTRGARPARPVVTAVSSDDLAARSLPGVSLGLFGLSALTAVMGLRGRLRAAPAVSLCIGTLVAGGLVWDRPQPRFEAPWQRGITVPAEEQALVLFDTLHRNIYAAFDAASEDEIYDLLAVSVAPALLDGLYGEVYESLILREDGGAVCSIQEIEVLERSIDSHPDPEAMIANGVEPGSDQQARFHVDTSWRVHGVVSHWGHIHRRVNQYRASYAVQHDGGSWKIAGVEIQDHTRVDEGG